MYDESLSINVDKQQEFFESGITELSITVKPEQPSVDSVLHRLNNPLDCLVICKMNDKVGYGLFAGEDIPPGVLFLYSGAIKKAKPFQEKNAYHYSYLKNSNLAVDSRLKGGLARFLQHLPLDTDAYKANLKNELLKQFSPDLIRARNIDLDEFVNEMAKQGNDDEYDNLLFPSEIKRQLATSNVSFSTIKISGIPSLVLWNKEKIKKGQQLGFSYGKQYWQNNNIVPRYFNLSGEMLDLPQKNIIPKSSFVLMPDKSANPLILYNEAVNFYKNKEYSKAIDFLQSSITLYKDCQHAEIKIYTCYSTLASCHRELGDYSSAAEACMAAMNYLVPENKEEQRNISVKYKGILSKQNSDPDELYKLAVNSYKEKKYILGHSQLEFCLAKWLEEQPLPNEKIAIGYSTMISFCRELGETQKALEYCNVAENFAVGNANLIEKIHSKKNQLENIIKLPILK